MDILLCYANFNTILKQSQTFKCYQSYSFKFSYTLILITLSYEKFYTFVDKKITN